MTDVKELDPTKEKAVDLRAVQRTVQALPRDDTGIPGTTSLLYLNFASVADQFIPWGRDVFGRDKQLREFWPNETMLAGAMYSIAASHAAFAWHLEGPDKLVEIASTMLHSACLGQGWEEFIIKVTVDLMGQDNGAFIELIRQERRPDAPVIAVNHLDANVCRRTGNPEYPIVYTDMNGSPHKLAWFDVITLEEMPSPIQTMYSVQICAVSRVLRMAQIMRDLAVYKAEKISGRFERAIHIVGGPAKSQIDDAIKRGQERADNEHLTRFIMPMILASLDPEKPVSHVEIPLADLPDGFDFDEEFKWYVAGLALGFGRDYQDFAPLPGGNLGSSQQAEILHLKSRGKGPALFMAMLANAFNWHGVLPRSVRLVWEEQDLSAESDQAKMKRLRAETRKTRIDCGEISPEVARHIAIAEGDLDPKLLPLLEAFDTEQRRLETEALASFRARRRRLGGEDFEEGLDVPTGVSPGIAPPEENAAPGKKGEVQEAARAVELAAQAVAEAAAKIPRPGEIELPRPIIQVSVPEQKDQTVPIMATLHSLGERIESAVKAIRGLAERPQPDITVVLPRPKSEEIKLEKLPGGGYRATKTDKDGG